jgi:hypothetical protein
MSKFGEFGLMKCLDIEHPEIKKREYTGTTKPFYEQDVCIVRLNLAKLNPQCAKCRFCSVIRTQGKINELGVGGYMSNQPDGLTSVEHNPSKGIKLREPRTIIIGEGEAYACTNREQTKTGTFFVTDVDPSCANDKPKIAIKA